MFDESDFPRLTPGWIAAIYLAFGIVALVLFDLVLPRFLAVDSLLRGAQFVKGVIEVVLTAGLVYLLALSGQRTLAAANERLERKDEALQVLLRLLRHNVRNDVNVIRGHADIAHDEADEEMVEHSCSIILDTTDDLLHKTETVNRLRDVFVGTSEPTRFDLSVVVDDVCQILERRGFAGQIEDADVEAATVVANPLLPVAVREVVENAIEHTDDSSPTIEFDVERAGDDTLLRIADDGPGIPAHELTPLAEGEESPLSHTSGIGLWFVHWIVTSSGGDVAIRERAVGGTVVELSLPAVGEV